mmetsp:Transcript_68414/g.198363  ORF Transcript_68414/g.198363 Transcript_68414/m.198363 type:complete len:413 (-) Transcript_68414:87-1325(-)
MASGHPKVLVAQNGSSCHIQDGAPAAASTGALAGVLLLFGGLGGIVLYIVTILPPAVQFFSTVASIGAVLVARELRLNDQLACGVSLGDVLVHVIRLWQAVCVHVAVMFSLPDITSADLRIIWQGLATQDSAATGVRQVAAPKSSTNGAAPPRGSAQQLPGAAADSGAALSGMLHSERSFVLARQWLQRPDLKMGLGDQLEVYGLYQRAQAESFSESLAQAASKTGVSWLAGKQFEVQRACRDISQASARARLASAVAAADPLFVVAHPEFAMPRPGDHVGMMLSLAERRMPRNLGEVVGTLHRRLLWVSVSCALGAALRWAQLRSAKTASPRRLVMWLCAAVLGAVSSGYSLALVKGLPIKVHVAVHIAIAKLFGASSKEPLTAGTVSARLRQYLVAFLAPRVQQSLFLQR